MTAGQVMLRRRWRSEEPEVGQELGGRVDDLAGGGECFGGHQIGHSQIRLSRVLGLGVRLDFEVFVVRPDRDCEVVQEALQPG